MAVQGTERTGVNVAKAVAATTATAAVATGTVLLLARKGKLDQFVGKSQVTDKAINGAKSLADDIAKYAEPITNKISNVAKAVKGSKPVKAVTNFFNKAVNFVRTRLGKFNPDLAPASEKMADTFNNFVK